MVPMQHLKSQAYVRAKTYFNAIYLYDPGTGWAIIHRQLEDWVENCAILSIVYGGK